MRIPGEDPADWWKDEDMHARDAIDLMTSYLREALRFVPFSTLRKVDEDTLRERRDPAFIQMLEEEIARREHLNKIKSLPE